VFTFRAVQNWQLKTQMRKEGSSLPADENDPSELFLKTADERFDQLRAHLRDRYWATTEPD